MTSEDWKIVLLAFIAAMVTISTAGIAVYGQMLLFRARVNDLKTDKAVVAAEDTREAVNGHLEQMRKDQYEKGFAAGQLAEKARREAGRSPP